MKLLTVSEIPIFGARRNHSGKLNVREFIHIWHSQSSSPMLVFYSKLQVWLELKPIDKELFLWNLLFFCTFFRIRVVLKRMFSPWQIAGKVRSTNTMCEFMASEDHVSIMKTREVLRCCIAYWSRFLSKETHYWKHIFGQAGKLC